MGDLNRNLEASSPSRIVGSDELYAADVILEEGLRKLIVSPVQSNVKAALDYFSIIQASNFLNGYVYEQVVPTYSGANNENLLVEYYYSGFVIASANISNLAASNWSITIRRYILDDNGSRLLDDDGTELYLD